MKKIFQSIFRFSQNCGRQGQKMAKFFFAIVKHRFGKPPLSRDYYSYVKSENGIGKRIKFGNRKLPSDLT